MSKTIMDCKFIQKWRDTQMITLTKIYPDIPETTLLEILNREIKARCVNVDARIHNNYENRTINTDLLNVTDWIYDKKPIIAGFGVFFYNQDQRDNPLADLMDLVVSNRAKIKSKLKLYNYSDPRYDRCQREQSTEKITVNSFYGGCGCPTFKCFNLYTASAITKIGQQLISTARACFESFMTNTDKFLDLNECIQFILDTIYYETKFPISIVEPVTGQELFNRLKVGFVDYKDEYNVPLFNFIQNLSDEEITRCYYKNNLYDFLECKQPMKILKKILSVLNQDDYFVSCEKIPKNINKNLAYLKDLLLEFVYSDILQFNRIERNKTCIRKTVITQDTDSVMPGVYQWCMYCYQIENDNGYGTDIEEQDMLIANANIIAFILKAVIDKCMYSYTTNSNILEEYKPRVNMKNEYLFSRQVIAETKKRYLSLQLLREGVVLNPPKPDYKGFDFMKTTTNIETKKEMEKIINENILFPKNIDLLSVITRVKTMENNMVESLRKGEKTHLTPAKVKPAESYAKPLSNMGFRAVLTWNIAYPSKEIQLPDDVDIVKLSINDISDIEFIKQYDEDVYNNIYQGIYNSYNKDISSKGLKVIAIPRNEPVPEWVKEIIDVDTIAGDTISKIYPVLSSLGIKIFGKKTSSSKVFYSNLIDF